MHILDKIVAHKQLEVQQSKRLVSLAELKNMELFGRKCFSLKESLLNKTKTGIIAEFKRQSPSKGVINDHSDITEVTAAYTKNGASGLSVLTDQHFFGGSLADLQAARANTIPILRKDFMVDEYQFFEAKAYGADVVLLIAACLSPQQVVEFSQLASELGLEVLLEIHNTDELGHICESVDFVGVNNRNLKTFEVDIQTSLDLYSHIPKDKLAITESGISSVESIHTLGEAGYQGFLIGENFMKQPDPGAAFAEFVQQL